jgi:UDP-glucose 4-epimerase
VREMKKVLVTGGLGFIGSHTVVELIEQGYEVVIIDNLSNAVIDTLARIKILTGKAPVFYQVDMRDLKTLQEVFESENDIDIVIHFAAFKAVAESVDQPLKYFNNNLLSLLNLLTCMDGRQCTRIVFSSSATVYGDPEELPVKETTAFKTALSAYGSTKQIGEEILQKVSKAGGLHAISLRYFNPVGAHPSGLIGEMPLGKPNNLMPLITKAAKESTPLTVFGKDYDTPDGSCIRDYIHVCDLAVAHVKSCDRLLKEENKEAFEAFNVGTGKGVSVLELINCFIHTNGINVPYVIADRRPGDAAAIFADCSKLSTTMNWAPQKTLKNMVEDAWNWEQKNKL